MDNFWDSSVWSSLILVAVLLLSLLVANILRRGIPFLRNSLIPTSVLGGALLLGVEAIYHAVTGVGLFENEIFNGRGTAELEIITYHCLALGFIASALKKSKGKLTPKRTGEIFNTGVTTVATYLIQAIFGLCISLVAVKFVKDFFRAAGILLPFGYGQGTGQALNYGNIFETDYGFTGGKSFGLTIAAMGFLCASIGGVIHLNILKRKGIITIKSENEKAMHSEQIQSEDEIPMQESIDKMTIQISLIAAAYLLTYGIMYGLGLLLPGMKSVVYGFNFLIGVLAATLIKLILNGLRKIKVIRKEFSNEFLLTRASNFFFDIMVVAGIAAIRISILKNYWGILLIMGIVGMIITYIYNHIVARNLFPEYMEEQFLTMYGMLTGTASTGVILLREIDGDFKTPAMENMVYQNFPAIVFGFPMMLLATLAPKKPYLTLAILIAFFAVMNIILFRSKIFRKKKQKE
ncbi:MAG: hypothetical protein IKI20_00090 [Lachnospiraceae bacterium]|nr:hypothetical protein [Lachnospiraceae bacterium]